MRQSKNVNSHFMIKDFTHRTSYMTHQFYWNVAEKKKHFRTQTDPNDECNFGAIGQFD